MTASAPALRFNIRLWFGVASLVVIGGMAVAFGFLMSEFVAQRLLYREAEVTSEFLQSIVQAEHSAGDVFDPTTPNNREALESFTDHMVHLPGVYRANMYDTKRVIVWSTDSDLTGKRFTDNDELEVAFRGKLLVEIGTLDAPHHKAEHAALEHVAPHRFIEAYIPITDPRGVLTGVVELYKSPAALDETISRGRELIWLSAAAGGLIVYLTLFWIVQRGARLIDHQQSRLTEMETMAAVGQMASALAHSFRNPLAAIRSSAELMALGDAQTLQRAAGDIMADVDRLDGHVRDLLTYTRAENLRSERLDPLDVARACLADMRNEITRRRIEVAIDATGTGAHEIEADRMLLHQAIASLASNALEAVADGGKLRIAREADGAARRVRLSLRDDGSGITPETLAKLAKPFYTTKTRGLGLGLVLARRIVERFGGRLTIDSEPGRGTTVMMDFEARG